MISFSPRILFHLMRASSADAETIEDSIGDVEIFDGNDAFYRKGGKSAYDTDLGKKTNRFHRGLIRIIVENALYDLLKLFETNATAKEKSCKPRCLSGKPLCDLSDNQLHDGCMRYEQK